MVLFLLYPRFLAKDKGINIVFRGMVRRANDQACIMGYLQTNGFAAAADDLINVNSRQCINYGSLRLT